MHPWVYLALGLVVSAYALLWSRQRRARALLAGLPSFPELPLLGNLLLMIGDGKYIFGLLSEITRMSEETMKPVQFWIGPYPLIVISDPDDIRTVTNAFIEKPFFYSFAKIWLGDGLLTAPGAIWKQSIKKLNANIFNATVVEGFQVVFNAQAQRLVENLKKEVGNEPFDIMHLLAYTSLEAICQTSLGMASIMDRIVTKEYYDAFDRSFVLFIERGLNPLVHPDCVYRLTPAYRELKKCIAVLQNFSDKVLKNRMVERKKLNSNGTTNQDKVQTKKFKAYLDILLDLSESDPRFTEKLIKNEVDTIILGGQETVATSLFFTMLMIGCRPKVQEKLYNEIESIFGGTIRPVEKADLQQMVYCEAVLNESLRLFPPGPVVMREATHELQLKSCRVPNDTVCAINVWGTGRSKHTWGPDAHEFDPERWLDGRVPSNSAAFLPFSYGRRSCIGKKYAMAIMKTILACCVRELKFTSNADQLEFKIDVMLRADSGHLIQVAHRE